MKPICPVRVGLPKNATLGDCLHQIQDQLVATIHFKHEGFLVLACLARNDRLEAISCLGPWNVRLRRLPRAAEGPVGELHDQHQYAVEHEIWN